MQISSFAFTNATSIEKVQLGNNATKIDSTAFSGCTSHTDIILNENLQAIGNSAFFNDAHIALLTQRHACLCTRYSQLSDKLSQ